MCTPALLCLVLNTLLVSLLVERMGGKGNENHARSFFTTVGASRHHDECFRSHPPCCGEGHQEGDGSVCQQHNFCALPVPQPAGASQTLAHEPHIPYQLFRPELLIQLQPTFMWPFFKNVFWNPVASCRMKVPYLGADVCEWQIDLWSRISCSF